MVPTTDLPEGDPETDMVFFNDDIVRIRARVKRLKGRYAYREYPWSRTRRFISTVRVKATDDNNLTVTANAIVCRFRSGSADPYVGSYSYNLTRVADGFKIRYRRAVLDLKALTWHGAVSIIFESIRKKRSSPISRY